MIFLYIACSSSAPPLHLSPPRAPSLILVSKEGRDDANLLPDSGVCVGCVCVYVPFRPPPLFHSSNLPWGHSSDWPPWLFSLPVVAKVTGVKLTLVCAAICGLLSGLEPVDGERFAQRKVSGRGPLDYKDNDSNHPDRDFPTAAKPEAQHDKCAQFPTLLQRSLNSVFDQGLLIRDRLPRSVLSATGWLRASVSFVCQR